MKAVGRTFGCQRQSTRTGDAPGRAVGGDAAGAAEAVPTAAVSPSAAQSSAAVLVVLCPRITAPARLGPRAVPRAP